MKTGLLIAAAAAALLAGCASQCDTGCPTPCPTVAAPDCYTCKDRPSCKGRVYMPRRHHRVMRSAAADTQQEEASAQ